MAAKNNSASTSNKTKLGVGLGLAAAAAAAAYYLYGTKEGAKRRVQIRGWTLRAKGEVLDKLETLKEVNEDAYAKVVDTVMEKYKKVKGVDVKDVVALGQDLKRHWTNIKKQLNGGSAPKKKSAARKPAAKKSSSK